MDIGAIRDMRKHISWYLYIYGRAVENIAKVNNPCGAKLKANNLWIIYLISVINLYLGTL